MMMNNYTTHCRFGVVLQEHIIRKTTSNQIVAFLVVIVVWSCKSKRTMTNMVLALLLVVSAS
jgi:hypothetical protein